MRPCLGKKVESKEHDSPAEVDHLSNDWLTFDAAVNETSFNKKKRKRREEKRMRREEKRASKTLNHYLSQYIDQSPNPSKINDQFRNETALKEIDYPTKDMRTIV